MPLVFIFGKIIVFNHRIEIIPNVCFRLHGLINLNCTDQDVIYAGTDGQFK